MVLHIIWLLEFRRCGKISSFTTRCNGIRLLYKSDKPTSFDINQNIYLAIALSCSALEEIVKPNIVFIVADDLGWNDVSFHGSDQIMTPNIDVLAYEGVILHKYYSDTLGTSSRSALFTGRYPMRLGIQGSSIKAAEDRGLPISELLLPSYLRDLGYETHLIGKWHLGKSRERYLPTYRGFDTFYGFLGDSVDYFTYNHIENWNKTSFFGLDLFEDTLPLEDQTGYLTDLITDRAVKLIREHHGDAPLYLHVSHAAPHCGGGLVSLQPPADTIAVNDHIAHSARRLYAGLVTSLDKSVGHIVAALAERAMLENTLIVFVSDNGAPGTGSSQNFGCNLPLRGVKGTPWEGAARSVAVLWHASLSPRTLTGLYHVTDWLPTLVAAAGGSVNGTIDGINQWDPITKHEESKRSDVLITIDDLNDWAAFREGDYKIIVGNLDTDISGYHGAELKALRHEAPLYENALLDSETYRVFKETLDVILDIEEAFMVRNETTLTQIVPLQDEDFCVPTKVKGCLYNISGDPLETQDLWDTYPDIVRHMTLRLRTIWAEIKPRHKPMRDSRANPSNRNYTWSPWVDNEEIIMEPPTSIPSFPLQVTMNEFQYLVDLNLNMFKEKMFEGIKNMGDSFVKSVGGLFSF